MTKLEDRRVEWTAMDLIRFGNEVILWFLEYREKQGKPEEEARCLALGHVREVFEEIVGTDCR